MKITEHFCTSFYRLLQGYLKKQMKKILFIIFDSKRFFISDGSCKLLFKFSNVIPTWTLILECSSTGFNFNFLTSEEAVGVLIILHTFMFYRYLNQNGKIISKIALRSTFVYLKILYSTYIINTFLILLVYLRIVKDSECVSFFFPSERVFDQEITSDQKNFKVDFRYNNFCFFFYYVTYTFGKQL